MSDDDIIQKASVESWILITNDKDFGGKIEIGVLITALFCCVLRMNGLLLKSRPLKDY